MDNPNNLTTVSNIPQIKKILILEDDDLILRLFSDELKAAGFEVDSFSLGGDALKAADEKVYDLLLLDIMLPDTNGLDVLKQVRAASKNKDSKAVMLTNLGQDSVIKEAYKLGVSGFLIKSAYNPDQIVQEIKKILEQPVGFLATYKAG